MKITDTIFAFICGLAVAWIASDFLKGYGAYFRVYALGLYFLLPIISLICLQLANLIGKKILFIFQAAKFFLVGVFATIVDLKIFQVLIWFFSFFLFKDQLIAKGISFLIATYAKYWGNKHWVFEKPEKENQRKEIIKFFVITLVGLAIDVGSFYYFTKIMGPQFATPVNIWTELSVIFAALTSSLWNFLGYKFIVFKK
ncbi:MAG: GtrA family protein [Patescibacteria group bacterium]